MFLGLGEDRREMTRAAKLNFCLKLGVLVRNLKDTIMKTLSLPNAIKLID